MSNRINPYSNALNRYQQVSRPDAGQGGAEQVQRSQAPNPPQRTETVAPAAKTTPQDLSRAEQQMINRYFPESEAMTLRVYGANRNAQTINPGALGSRLDLKG